jgi:hypothetical protein
MEEFEKSLLAIDDEWRERFRPVLDNMQVENILSLAVSVANTSNSKISACPTKSNWLLLTVVSYIHYSSGHIMSFSLYNLLTDFDLL